MKNINSVALFNRTDAQLLLTLEPWAEQFIVESGKRLELKQVGAGAGEPIELEYTDDGIVVHSGGVVTVFQDGVEIEPLKEWIDKL